LERELARPCNHNWLARFTLFPVCFNVATLLAIAKGNFNTSAFLAFNALTPINQAINIPLSSHENDRLNKTVHDTE
jgi:hypothetical protein